MALHALSTKAAKRTQQVCRRGQRATKRVSCRIVLGKKWNRRQGWLLYLNGKGRGRDVVAPQSCWGGQKNCYQGRPEEHPLRHLSNNIAKKRGCTGMREMGEVRGKPLVRT
eukprot:1161133-Pelagomonas_calceolata.AAC.25